MKTPKKNKSTKIAAGALALALLSAGGIATYAGFTDEANSAITVTAGTIDLQLGSAKTYPIDLGTMKPGDTVTKTITVNNKGTLPLTYTATTVGATSGELAAVLNTNITSGATAVVTAKKLNAIAVPARPLVAKTGTETLTLTITWPNGAPTVDNALMGKSGNTTLLFSATQ